MTRVYVYIHSYGKKIQVHKAVVRAHKCFYKTQEACSQGMMLAPNHAQLGDYLRPTGVTHITLRLTSRADGEAVLVSCTLRAGLISPDQIQPFVSIACCTEQADAFNNSRKSKQLLHIYTSGFCIELRK